MLSNGLSEFRAHTGKSPKEVLNLPKNSTLRGVKLYTNRTVGVWEEAEEQSFATQRFPTHIAMQFSASIPEKEAGTKDMQT